MEASIRVHEAIEEPMYTKLPAWSTSQMAFLRRECNQSLLRDG